jgi:adenosylmethionine-8-amino-7-oxononanoate aminotransferase
MKQRTRDLIAKDKQYVWHPFTQMQDWLGDPEPLVIERAKGNRLIDSEGRSYLDGVSSLWVTVHGHGHPAVDKAIREQLKKLDHSTLLGLASTPSIELAEALAKAAPAGLNKVFYSDSGSTAMEIALKLAYQYWQNLGFKKKRSFVTFSEAYHGDTVGSVSLGGIDLFHKVYKKLLFPTIQLPTPYGSGDPKKGRQALRELEGLLKRRHKEIAAVVLEPLVQGAAGMLLAPKGLLLGARRLTKKYGVLLICDEVATGFGRTGKLFACQHEGVTPDLMAVAKGLSGGVLPLAATLATPSLYSGFLFPYKDQKTFFHGHTYTGNPLACAAALASLKLFKSERTLEKLKPKIRFLKTGLAKFARHPQVKEVRQCGMMVGIELLKDKKRGIPYAWEEKIGVRACRLARDKGVILRPLGPVIVLMPPLSITLRELDTLLKVAWECVDEATK